MKHAFAIGLLTISAMTAVATAHEDAAAPGASRVTVEVRDGYRHIAANGIPDHKTGRFPGPGNPHTIRPQEYAFKVPAEPKPAGQPTRAGGPVLFGVALNGVVFDPGTAEWWNDDPATGWNYEAIGGRINLGLDASNAHVQPNGAYHYHGIPLALLDKLKHANPGDRMTLVGWAADGYPIYAGFGHADANDASSPLKPLRPGYRLKSGKRPERPDGPGGTFDGAFTRDFEFVSESGDLDECNGRTGVTPEFPKGTYYYVLTDSFPFVPRMFHGTPDESFRKQPRRGGAGGPPPRRRRP
jgi:hypothetical protein